MAVAFPSGDACRSTYGFVNDDPAPRRWKRGGKIAFRAHNAQDSHPEYPSSLLKKAEKPHQIISARENLSVNDEF